MAFDFKRSAVTAITDDDGNPWWIAKGVCDILEIANVPQAIERLDEDEKLLSVLHMSGQNREAWTINESGLYSLILRSRKPEAKAFKKWITSEVLPAIRKTGKYEQAKPPLALPDFTNPAEAARVWAEQFERLFS